MEDYNSRETSLLAGGRKRKALDGSEYVEEHGSDNDRKLDAPIDRTEPHYPQAADSKVVSVIVAEDQGQQQQVLEREMAELESDDDDESLNENLAGEDEDHHTHPAGVPRTNPTMILDDVERGWALQLKRLVENSLEIPNGSDMEYAQQAIVAGGDLHLALRRMEGLQRFRDTYQIDDTPTQGLYYIQEFIRLQPSALLHLDICPLTGEGVLAWNSGSLDPKIALQHSPGTMFERNWNIHVCAFYYLMQAMTPSLETIREGVFLLLDGVDMRWKNISMTFQCRLQEELIWYYPLTMKSIMEYNSNSASTIFWGLTKAIVPKKWTSVLEVGCKVECSDYTKPTRTLAELYLQPSPEEATYYLLQKANELLATRADNNASFQLFL
jgi:hypothetical protein